MSPSEKGPETPRRIDILLMRVFYVEAILLMTGMVALGIYLYPTIMRFVELSFKFEEVGDIGALVDDQVARVEGKLMGVTGRLDKQLSEVDTRISGVTSRLEEQVTGVEKRLDGMFKGLEDRLRNILKFKIGKSGGAPPRTAAAPSR